MRSSLKFKIICAVQWPSQRGGASLCFLMIPPPRVSFHAGKCHHISRSFALIAIKKRPPCPKRTQRTSQTRGTTSVYRLRGLIGYNHIRSAISGAPGAAYHSEELQGAAQDGNWDTASPLPCTCRQLSEEDHCIILLRVLHRVHLMLHIL